MDEVYRQLGEQHAEIRNLREDVDEVKRDVKFMLGILSEAKGGWKTIALIAGVASMATVLGTKLLAILSWVPK